MALSASTVLEVRSGGLDTNGGGYVSGGTDWSLQTGPQYSVADGVTNGTTTITSATAAFGTDVVGNIMYVQGGTGAVTAGWYQIITRTSATAVVVDRTTGLTAGTGVTLHIGGALLSPAIAASIMTVAGMIAYVKNDGAVFSVTSATTNVAGGTLSPSADVLFIGYATTRSYGNTDTGPTIQTNVSTATIAQGTTTNYYNIIFDGNSQTAAKLASNGVFVFCQFKNFNTVSSGSGQYFNCGATTNSAAIFTGMSAYRCEAWANTATPFGNIACTKCISSNNTGGSTDGFAPLTGTLDACISVGNGRTGFALTAGNAQMCANCHAESNTGVGFSQGNGVKVLMNCSAFGNSAATSGTFVTSNFQSLSSSAFTNVGAFIYTLNNTASAGALLRSAGYPALYQRGLTADYEDIGAVRHIDPTASSNIFPIFD